MLSVREGCKRCRAAAPRDKSDTCAQRPGGRILSHGAARGADGPVSPMRVCAQCRPYPSFFHQNSRRHTPIRGGAVQPVVSRRRQEANQQRGANDPPSSHPACVARRCLRPDAREPDRDRNGTAAPCSPQYACYDQRQTLSAWSAPARKSNVVCAMPAMQTAETPVNINSDSSRRRGSTYSGAKAAK